MGVSYNARLVTDGMILCLDPANSLSYDNRENYISYSNYDPRTWRNLFPQNTTLVTGIDAPDGTNTAARIICNNSTGGTATGYQASLFRVNFPDFTADGFTTYTVSFYVRLISGSSSNSGQLTSDLHDAGPGFDYKPLLVQNQWVRVSASAVPVSGVKNFLDLLSDNPCNYTLDFWGVQIERGSTASTLVPTSGSPITRTFYDLNTNLASTFVGSFGINTTAYGVPTLEINNNGTTSNGQVQVNTQDLNYLATTQNFTVMFAAKKNFYGLAGQNTGNSQLFQGVVNGYTSGWRLREDTTGTPGSAFTSRHNWGLGYTEVIGSSSNLSLNAQDNASSTNRMCIVAFTVSPTTITAFCNGTTTTRSNLLTYVQNASTPRISFTGAGMGSFNGLLGYFAIYNRALSQTEIEQNYNVLRVRYGI